MREKIDKIKNFFKSNKSETEASNAEKNPYEEFLEEWKSVNSKESFLDCTNKLTSNSAVKDNKEVIQCINDSMTAIINIRNEINKFGSSKPFLESVEVEKEFFSGKLKSILSGCKEVVPETKRKKIETAIDEASRTKKEFDGEVKKLGETLSASIGQQGKTIEGLEDKIEKMEAFCKLTENIDNLDKQNISKDKEQIIKNYDKDLVDDWKVCSSADKNNKDNLKELVSKNKENEGQWVDCVKQLSKINSLNCSIDKIEKKMCDSLNNLIKLSEDFIKEYERAVGNGDPYSLKLKQFDGIKQYFKRREINVKDAVYCLKVLLENLMYTGVRGKFLEKNALWNSAEWNSNERDFKELFDKFIITKDNIEKHIKGIK